MDKPVKRLSPASVALLNKVDAPMVLIAHMVPLRIVRIVASDASFKTFRVEQLNMTGGDVNDPKGSWITLSTHSHQVEGGAYPTAFEAAVKAQADLRRKLMRRMEQAQRATGSIIR